jgi:hypothetical protein
MRLRLLAPDVTFVAAVALVATVQAHYWDLAPKVGGTRQAEILVSDLARVIFDAVWRPTSAFDVSGYRYFDPLTVVLGVVLFILPTLPILLVGRTRSPRLTSLVLRLATALYVAWLLVLSPKVNIFSVQ